MKEKNVKYTLQERLVQVASLCTQGYSIAEIAEETGLNSSSVLTYISSAKRNGLLSNCVAYKNSFGKTKKLSSSISNNLINDFINSHPDIFVEGQSSENISIEQIAEIVKSLGYPKSDVNLLVRLYSNNSLFEEAVSLLYLYQNNNELTDEEIKNIEILRHHLRVKESKIFFGRIPSTLIGNSSDSIDER